MSFCDTHNLEKENISINEKQKQKQNKIRKRGCSSSSSSSLVRRYRFKRAILVGKKGGSSTSVPMWKTSTKSPSRAVHQHSQHNKSLLSSGVSSKEKELSLSARKLAATLWEINDLPPSMTEKDLDSQKTKKEIRCREKARSLSISELLLPRRSDPTYSPISERMKGVEGDNCKRRVSHHKLELADYYLGGLGDHSSSSLMEVGKHARSNTCDKCIIGVENGLKEARNGLSTSKKLLKVLNQMCLQEQHPSSIPLILALGSELDRVGKMIDQLIQEHSSSQNDIEHLMKRFADEKAAWKRREREKVHNAITSIASELEVEKKLRRQTERLNKKIAKEMAHVKASHLKASKDLEREKRAKEILEQICDELARGIGEDRAQVEELKRESAKVREEVEKEREMLQLADVLREERVQMKLSEAKFQFEEKNAVLEKLRHEVEAFLKSKECEENGDISPEFKKIKDLEDYLKKTFWEFHNAEKEEDNLDDGDGLEHDGDDSADSDLHSIELNLDNDNRCYQWSYAFENDAEIDPERVPVEKENMGRKSISEIIQWGSICFNKGNINGKKRVDQEISNGLFSQPQKQDHMDEADGIMRLRDILSCANIPQTSAQSLPLQDGENSPVLEGSYFKQEAQ